MASPLGLFVQVATLPPSAGEVRKWFDRIVKDHKRKGSPYYIKDLTLEFIAKRDAKDGKIKLCRKQLNWIKNYLPYFDNVFVGGPSPFGTEE